MEDSSAAKSNGVLLVFVIPSFPKTTDVKLDIFLVSSSTQHGNPRSHPLCIGGKGRVKQKKSSLVNFAAGGDHVVHIAPRLIRERSNFRMRLARDRLLRC